MVQLGKSLFLISGVTRKEKRVPGWAAPANQSITNDALCEKPEECMTTKATVLSPQALKKKKRSNSVKDWWIPNKSLEVRSDTLSIITGEKYETQSDFIHLNAGIQLKSPCFLQAGTVYFTAPFWVCFYHPLNKSSTWLEMASVDKVCLCIWKQTVSH